MTLKEIRAERAKLETRAEEIVKAIDPEAGITGEAKAELDKLHTRSMQLKDQADAMERLEEIRSGNDQHGEGPPSHVRSNLDRQDEITEDVRATAFQGFLRSECRMPLEKRHEEAMQRCRIPMDRGELILRTARTDQLHLAQHNFLHKRAALDLTTADSIVPTGFVNRLEETMLTHGPFLQFIDWLVTDHGNEMKWPVEDDTSEEAVIIDELGSTATEAPPTITHITLRAHKYFAKRIPVSSELLTDSPINLVEYLATTIGRRLGRGMNRDFTVGVGTTEPHGITVAADVGKTVAAVDAITSDEIIEMTHSIDEAHRQNARWMMHDLIVLEIRLLKDAHTGNYLWRAGIEQNEPDRLAGYPVVRNGHMASTLVADAVAAVFGDLSKYKGRRVNGVRLKREYILDNDSEVFTGFQRADGDLINPAAVKSLVMAAV